jgi:dTMP kinase
MPPLFITFEGIDGAGKTSQLQAAAWFLRKQKRRVRVYREPGGTRLGDHIRDLLLHGEDVSALAEASLFAAARAQLVETLIRPSLEAGWDVVCDRYIDSSIAYQVYGRRLDLDRVAAWNAYVVRNLVPTRTYFLSLAAEDATMRLARQLRLFGEDNEVGTPDRLERESLAFRRRVQDGYEQLAARFQERILKVDAYRRPAEIKEVIRDDLTRLLAREGQSRMVPT